MSRKNAELALLAQEENEKAQALQGIGLSSKRIDIFERYLLKKSSFEKSLLLFSTLISFQANVLTFVLKEW